MGDRTDAEPHRSFQGDPERLVNFADLFDCDAQTGEVPRPAVLFGTSKSEKAQISHEIDRFQRGLVGGVPALDMGCEVTSSEVSNRGPEVVVFLAKRERTRHKALSVVQDPLSA